jgi:hypothetical protein
MRWPEDLAHIVVVLAVVVAVLDDKGYGRTSRATLKNAGEETYLILLVTLGGYRALAGTAPLHLATYKTLIDDYPGGEAIDNTSNCHTM